MEMEGDVTQAKEAQIVVYFKIIMFFLIYRYLNHLFLQSDTAKNGKTLYHRHRVANLLTSTTHSLVSGVWAFSIFVIHPQMWPRMMDWFEPVGYYLVLMSTGYLLQDVFDLIIRDGCNWRTCELFVHHTVCIVAFMCAVNTQRFVALAALALLMELNSVFLHTRTMLRLTGRAASRAARWVAVANVATFMPLRLGVNVYMGAWVWRHRQLTGHAFYAVFGVAGSAFMFLLNLTLLYRVLRADFWQGRREKAEKATTG